MKYLEDIGSYFLMLRRTFSGFTKGDVLRELIFKEIDDLVMSSLGIVSFIGFFVGGVITLQTALNLTDPIISIIMAGKVGSFITSSIGSMRVTEQIDALEVMGVNSLNYLVFPKIIALLTYPFLIAIAMFLGIFGGLIAGVYGGFVSLDEFIRGLQEDFIPFHLVYAFVKTYVFAFILATVPAWHGYYMKGGALEVGKASTKSFVWTSVLIILANYIITQLLLS